MDILQEARDINRKSFLSHVFSTTDEGKAEVLNVIQYATLGVIPIVVLNKLIQKYVPEADTEKSTLELLVEIFVQLVVMFCGIIIIHRVISYIPTYSGFKYENLTLTNVILAFLIIVLSIQTKLGIKVNILVDRVYELWNGQEEPKKKVSGYSSMTGHPSVIPKHVPSQADFFDSSPNADLFPPAPVAVKNPVKSAPSTGYDQLRGSSNSGPNMPDMGGPVAANGVLGGSFGAFF
jgi:hypothetical protein